jgi:dihydrolipoamide dehydrogenase
MEKFDVVVIGGGPGGYPAAIRAAQLGASVALVEKEALGGTCLNWGCIPTKTLIASSDLYARMRHAGSLGLKTGKTGYDYAAMTARKDSVVKTLRGGVEQLLKANGVTVFTGTASFEARNRIAVTGGKAATTIEADKVIIATGATSAVPGFLPSSKRILESRAFLDLTELPRKLIVLGGGVIGCEFACMAAQLGVQVTVVEMLDDILMVIDKDVRQELRRHMEGALKIKVMTGEAMADIEVAEDGVSGTVGKKTVRADMMLVSIGRRPVTDGLALERAGLETNERGFIETGTDGRTRRAGIYAIGDVTAGTTQLAHAATAQGVAAAENAVLGTRNPASPLVPACIFTAPEIGSVGLSEAQALERGQDVRVGKFTFNALGKALAAGETDGFVKWVADPVTDRLLGAQAVGAHATELISQATLAIQAELTVEELGRTIHCHPTFSEAWMEAAHAAHGTCIHAAPKRRK